MFKVIRCGSVARIMSKQDAPPSDLFVSYAQADRDWVVGYLLDALIAAGVRVRSTANFTVGAPRLAEFETALKQCSRILLVLSPAYLADAGLQFVDLIAQQYGLESGAWPVIPLLLHPTPLPPRLAFLVALDAIDPALWPDVVARVCAEVRSGPPTPAAKPICPYPGMRAFRPEEARYFHGREAEIDELIQRLRHFPFVAVIGASGSGKSSLVLAGLIPALQRSTLFGAGGWLMRVLRPGAQPLAALRHALGVTELMHFTPDALLAAQTDAARLLLVIDQGEELFTQGAAEATDFFVAVKHIVALRQCYVVLTLRADFFDDLLTSSLWPIVQPRRVEIAPLDAVALRAAIVKPAEDVGVFIESALVERLVAGSAGEPGLLPFVQEVMVRLWEKLERRYLPLRAYEAMVLPLAGYSGHERTGIQAAMAQLADEMIDRLDAEQQRIARRIFLRLVQFVEGRDPMRRQQPVTALRAAGDDPARFDSVLHYLTENRLVVLSSDESGAPRADLAHEAMLAGWPRLKAWVQTYAESETTRRRLEDRAAEWVRLGRRGGLLDEHEVAEIALWLTGDTAIDLALSEDCRQFVEQSQHITTKARVRRRVRNAVAITGVVTVTGVLLFLMVNYLTVRSLQSAWRTIDAPDGALSAVTSAGDLTAIGSYDYGVAYQQRAGTWSDWLNTGLPRSSPAQGRADSASSVRAIRSLALDVFVPHTMTVWVVDGGIYQFQEDTGTWMYIGAGVPVNSSAHIALAARGGVLLAAADDIGVYVRRPSAPEWVNLADIHSQLKQEILAVAFTSDGHPVVGGSTGLFRGEGEYPWTWRQFDNIQSAALFALDAEQNIYTIVAPTASGQRPSLICFDANGEPIGVKSQLPIAEFWLAFLQVAAIQSLVVDPTSPHTVFVADNFGAVYAATCEGNWERIGQQPVAQSVPGALTVRGEPATGYTLLWASASGVKEREIE